MEGTESKEEGVTAAVAALDDDEFAVEQSGYEQQSVDRSSKQVIVVEKGGEKCCK